MTAFPTMCRVDESDVEQLFKDKEKLGKEAITRITLKFIVEGKNEGIYSAVIATYESSEMFYLDAVYREPAIEKRARISIALPGRFGSPLILILPN